MFWFFIIGREGGENARFPSNAFAQMEIVADVIVSAFFFVHCWKRSVSFLPGAGSGHWMSVIVLQNDA